MRFYCATDSQSPARQLVYSLGSDKAVDAYQVTRRDAATMELQLFTGVQPLATAIQYAAITEVEFQLKRVDDFTGPAVVRHTAFDWKPLDRVYSGSPSINTIQLAACFCQATTATVVGGTARTLASGDFTRLVAMTSSSANTVTMPASLGSAAEVIYLLQAGTGQTTLAAASGVTLNLVGDASLTLTMGQTLKLTRTASNTWSVSIAPELSEVELMGEWTWSSAAAGTGPETSSRLTMKVMNDVIRGNESQPTDANAPSDYVRSSALESGFVRTDITQSLSSELKNRACDNIGALRTADLDAVNASVSAVAANVATHETRLDGHDTAIAAKASTTSVSAVSTRVTALENTTVRFNEQSLSSDEKDQVCTNIGAVRAGGAIVRTRQAATFNPTGNSTTVHLNGALNASTGTATARPVNLLDAGHTVSSYTGNVVTATAHGGTNNQPVQFTGTLWSGITAGTWYYLRAVTTNTFEIAATPGGAAIALSGTIASVKVLLPAAPALRHRRVGYVSAATSGASCGTRHNALQWARSTDAQLGGWTFSSRFMISDAAAVANARLFVGLTGKASGAVLANANPSTNVNLIGLGADSGDTTLSIMHNDEAGSATKIDLGSNFPSNTRNIDAFELVLTLNADLTILYKVKNLTTGNIASGNLATNLPLAELQLLAPQHWRNNGSTALAVGLDVIEWKMEVSA